MKHLALPLLVVLTAATPVLAEPASPRPAAPPRPPAPVAPAPTASTPAAGAAVTNPEIKPADPALLREEAKRLAAIPAAQRTKIVAAAKVLRARLDQPVAPGTKAKGLEEHAREVAASAGIQGESDITTLTFLVLMEASKSAREDLKQMMATTKAIRAAKGCKTKECLAAMKPTSEFDKATLDAVLDRTKGKLDSLSEMDEMESVRLQMAMDRLSKMTSTLSNILKTMHDTAKGILQNLK